MTVRARAHPNTNLHPPEWETLWPISTGKCAGKSSVTRTSTRGNTLLPSTLTLLIGLRVTHSWGCVYVCVCKWCKKEASFLHHLHTHTYTHPQEWVTLRPISRVSVLGKSVLPRVLVRVTLLLPAHLPVLIGQRVSHSGGCRLVLGCARARTVTDYLL